MSMIEFAASEFLNSLKGKTKLDEVVLFEAAEF